MPQMHCALAQGKAGENLRLKSEPRSHRSPTVGEHALEVAQGRLGVVGKGALNGVDRHRISVLDR